jgi:hypothetical protein
MGANPIGTTMKDRRHRHRPRIWSKAELSASCRRAAVVLQLVSNVFQILTKWPQNVRANVAAQDDLALRRDSDDQVRQLKASVLQTQADERISFAEDFSEDSGGVLLGRAAI